MSNTEPGNEKFTEPIDDIGIVADIQGALVTEANQPVLPNNVNEYVPEQEVENDLTTTTQKDLLVPRHKIVSAYILTAYEKNEFTEKDVLERLRRKHISGGAARVAIRHYLGGHENFYNNARRAAGNINWDALTKARKPKAAKTPLPARRLPNPEVREAERQERLQQKVNSIGSFNIAGFLNDNDRKELVISSERNVLSALDMDELKDAILPLSDTYYGQFDYSNLQRTRLHPHTLHILSENTLKICDFPEVELSKNQRRIFNIMLILGKVGLHTEALENTQVNNPQATLYALKNKLNKKVMNKRHFTFTKGPFDSTKIFGPGHLLIFDHRDNPDTN